MSETVFAADPTRLLIAALVRASVGSAYGYQRKTGRDNCGTDRNDKKTGISKDRKG